jgi:hypothetical protein
MDAQHCGGNTYSGSVELVTQAEVHAYPGYGWIQGALQIGEVPDKGPEDITTLGPLSPLRCTEHLDVTVNFNLASLEGLNNLTMSECVFIFWNGLVTLNGLDGLIWIGDGLHIEGNNELVDIDALSNLEWIGEGGLTIEDNESLPTCEAIALRDQLYAAGWDGPVCIEDNLNDACEDDTSGCP